MGGARLGDASAAALVLEEDHLARAVCNPGAYRRVCVELRLNHLAVNALHAAATVAEMEGGSFADGECRNRAQLVSVAFETFSYHICNTRAYLLNDLISTLFISLVVI